MEKRSPYPKHHFCIKKSKQEHYKDHLSCRTRRMNKINCYEEEHLKEKLGSRSVDAISYLKCPPTYHISADQVYFSYSCINKVWSVFFPFPMLCTIQSYPFGPHVIVLKLFIKIQWTIKETLLLLG